jgi:hypothetical protein
MFVRVEQPHDLGEGKRWGLSLLPRHSILHGGIE